MIKKTIVISIIVVLVFGGGILLSKSKSKRIKQDKALENYTLLNNTDVVSVKTGTVDNVAAFTGDLSPLNQAVISSEVDAQAKKVLVNEGQLVKKGQVLAVLDDTDLHQAVSEQQALLATLKAKSGLDKQKLDRQKELYDQGFISKLAYDELIANYEVSTEAIKQQQATLQRAQKKLSDTTIVAPFAGYIYQKNIDVGQLASKNSKLFSLASLDVMQIKAAIPSDQISNISVNQIVKFRVETSKEIYQGRITRVNPVAEVGTRAYMIYINFDNTKYNLKAGQFVKGQVILNSLATVSYIPTDSIRHNGKDNFVFVLSDNKIISKKVTVLISNYLLGISGVSSLNPGEQVLAGNVLTVKAGDKAKVLH